MSAFETRVRVSDGLPPTCHDEFCLRTLTAESADGKAPFPFDIP